MTGHAVWSKDDPPTYRYVLDRKFLDTESNRIAIFVLLNPSQADENVGDPTVRRCMAYARRWNCSGLTVLNIFALRSTDPKALYTHHEPIGSENDYYIGRTIRQAYLRSPADPIVICGWGAHGRFKDRGKRVLSLLREQLAKPPCALRLLSDGTPAHPLYLPADLEPVPLM